VSFLILDTYYSVLNAETELVLQVWSLYEDSSNRWATHYTQFHLNVILQALKHKHMYRHTVSRDILKTIYSAARCRTALGGSFF